MKTGNIKGMTRGWFIGDFDPSLLRTGAVEVAVKKYNEGDREDPHVHRIATEISVVISGTIIINGVLLTDGDYVMFGPGEPMTDLLAMSQVTTVVVKLPGVKNDKYPIGGPNT